MRTKEFGESDLLVTFLTPDWGRQKGIAKGACKSQKRFVNCLDIFCHVTLEYNLSRTGDLHFLKSAHLIDAYPGLRTNFQMITRASFMIELTEILFPWGIAEKRIFELLERFFSLMSNSTRQELFPLLFEFRAMSLGGYEINLTECAVCKRGYSGEGVAAFVPERGGIACLKCREITAKSPRVEPQTVKDMGLMQQGAYPMSKDSDLSKETISEIELVLKLHREYHLAKQPKTAANLT